MAGVGPVARLKSEADVRDVVVEAPDGTEVVAVQEAGLAGFYRAEIRVPDDAALGDLTLAVAAADLAGNVGRSTVTLRVLPPGRPVRAGLIPVSGLLIFAFLASLGIGLAGWRR